jgi:hypothetical protein
MGVIGVLWGFAEALDVLVFPDVGGCFASFWHRRCGG